MVVTSTPSSDRSLASVSVPVANHVPPVCLRHGINADTTPPGDRAGPEGEPQKGERALTTMRLDVGIARLSCEPYARERPRLSAFAGRRGAVRASWAELRGPVITCRLV